LPPEKTLDLQSVLKGDVAAARRALANHIEKLTLTPKEAPEGVVLDVSGDVDLFAGDESVMHLVARDGIGMHYTRLAIPVVGLQLDPTLDLAA
jgi:hypothetical protein